MIAEIVTSLILPAIPGVYVGPACAGHPARPSSSYTSALKIRQLHQLRYRDTNPAHYQEDHLVSLALGGAPRDPRNLWPQPLAQATRDDRIEYRLWRRVCVLRDLTARAAVRWERWFKRLHG